MSQRRGPGRGHSQSGQVMVLVAVALLALIGSAALVLLAGSVESQKNQLQELADSAALNAALKIGIGCDAGKANAVITEADNLLAARRTRMGGLLVTAGTCATPYKGQDTFTGGLTATINYPYRAHQQQVEVILSLALPISFGAEVGSTNTTVVRRAVAQQLAGSVPAVSATTLTCTGGAVNVSGSVIAQNLIATSGTCALYAHARLDAPSGTYSDLGNVSVYADGQVWPSAGTCAAGSNAICSDGFELSGHATPACATAATSFQSAGDKAVNPNPCAALTGPQPVAPRSAALPPEPNLDPNATATLLPAGTVCVPAPGVAYPPITIGGVTVGTGLGPAPGPKDASGFYHFKPSCYGYLNMGSFSAGGGITNVHTGPIVGPTRKTVTPTIPASQVGTLLVVDLRSETSPSDKPFTAPAGWISATPGGADQDGAAHVEIWYYPNNPGGITSADFGISPASVDTVAQMSEWSGVVAASPLDRTGVATVSAASKTATISTSAATTVPNELVITDIGFSSDQSPQTYTPGAGWTTLANDTTNFFGSEDRLNLPAAIASETVGGSLATTWALAMATFKPAAGGAAASGAVLDPGFYYFNGSGFAGGGGICLNGGTLLARDVTLEFVNAAGFSSGTCAAGGGAGNPASEFGSPPCSLPTCPPNVPADPPNNLTWFAAPCSAAPAAADAASCPVSAWCPPVIVVPPVDRACTNLLIWAAPASTGTIAITGAVAKAWLLGSIYWPSSCTYQVNGTSSIAGSLACGSLTISAGAGAAVAVGGDAGINTAVVEAVLIE